MSRVREVAVILAMAACGSVLYHRPVRAADAGPQQQENPVPQQAQPPATPAAPALSTDPALQTPQAGADVPQPQNQTPPPADTPSTPGKLLVTVGKSLIIDSPVNIKRVHVANGALAEAVAVNPKEVLINGTAAGETSLIVWQANDTRLVYDLTVRMSGSRLEATRQQIARDFPDDDVNLTFENDTAFLRGKVKDVASADRLVAIASTLGKVVNLLRVEVPPVQPQVVLKVRFANVDRSRSIQLGLNIFNSSFNQQTSLGTGYALYPDPTGHIPVPQNVNLLFLRPDINLVAELQALQTQNLLEMLAEPNLLAISGEQASFLAGGEFPFPVVQPASAGTAAVTIQWREYGVRLNFLPVVTPNGTIRLRVAPEVSALDYTNAVTVQGFTIPGLTARRVSTDVELESGQSFVIAGLLDNQTTEQLSKVPGISAIPVLGKLFQTKNQTKNNSELLVIITPEVVRPIPAGQPLPELNRPSPFLPTNTTNFALRQPGIDKTGPVPVKPPVDSLPYEMLVPKQGQNTVQPPPSPGPMTGAPAPAQPGQAAAPNTPAPAGTTGK
ncbi:MAG TPA: pilus assembly protein N-terminal domain-containing protein [Bryobacteraceae bacterium]|nr:pilus assembly protein N-terminal domain-containing protein [Bryobacteraceae bacterium]